MQAVKKRQTFGLGNANKTRRKTNASFDKRGWSFKRRAYFNRNVRFASAARAYRLANDVTQGEVASVFGVTASAVAGWESGKYGWKGDKAELNQYCNVIRRLASRG